METSVFRLRHRDILLLCVLGLLFLGVMMVQSAAMSISGEAHYQWSSRGTRHFIYALVAIGTFFAIGRMDYRRILPTSPGLKHNPILWLLGVSLVCSLLVLVPGIGMEVNGARRWLPLGPVQVQPSEMAKWAVVLFLAWWLSARPIDLATFKGFMITLLPVTLVCLLVVIQDFGTAVLIALCALTMMIAGRIKLWHLLVVMPPALLAGAWFIVHKEYRLRRMIAFLDPYASPQKEGYHMIQSLLSFATGGVGGRGLGNGVQKLGYLPEDTTDFIFAVICEELGLFGAMLTISLYLGILFVTWQVLRQKRDSFGHMLAFGVAAMIGLQAVINIAVATVSVPPKGLSLPLVSAGGSGLVITCAALGLLFSISRRPHATEPEAASRGRVITPALWSRYTVTGTDA